MMTFDRLTEETAPVESELIYHGRIIDLQRDTVRHGAASKTFDVVTHAGAAVIIPRLGSHHLVLVEQWRQAVRRRLWEVPAGLINPSEDPEIGAARELREETGFTAKRMTRLWSTYSAPGFCTELLHFYLAEELTAGDREPDEGEESMIVRTFHVDELLKMIERSDIVDMKTILAVMWAAAQLA